MPSKGVTIIKPEDYPLILTTKEMMEILQCGKEKMYEYARSKGFPRMKNSRTIRVPRDAFFEWIASNTQKNEEQSTTRSIGYRNTASRRF